MTQKNPGGIDKTQVWVAVIGVIGTIVVTIITLYANQPGTGTPTPDTPTNTPITVVQQNGGLCLEEYFSNVTAENRQDVNVGSSITLSSKKDAVYGVRLFDNGKLLGEMQFTGTSNSKSFNIVSVIDANCSQVFDYRNIDRPDANNTLENLENLGLNFTEGSYRVRMGWPSGNQIELLFSNN